LTKLLPKFGGLVFFGTQCIEVGTYCEQEEEEEEEEEDRIKPLVCGQCNKIMVQYTTNKVKS